MLLQMQRLTYSRLDGNEAVQFEPAVDNSTILPPNVEAILVAPTYTSGYCSI